MLRKVAGGGRWRAAVAETGTPQAALREDDDSVLNLVDAIRRRGWVAPALLALESGRPLALPAAQLLWLAQPALSLFLPREEIGRWARVLESPDTLERVIKNLETER